MKSVSRILSDENIINVLAADRARRIGMDGIEDEMRQHLSQQGSEIIALVGKYSKDGSHGEAFGRLKFLRNKHLLTRR